MIGVGGVIANTLFALTKFAHPPLLAGLALLPGVAFTANSSLRLQELTAWHYEKFVRLRNLLRELKYESLSEKETSQRWRLIDEEMKGAWPQPTLAISTNIRIHEHDESHRLENGAHRKGTPS